MDGLLNGFAFALLLTSLFVLRFRGWDRPLYVALYFVFFAALEMSASHFLLPPDAMGPELGYLCLALTVPVLVAAFLVWRHERSQGRAGSD
jgi:hypothetical protein